MSLTYGSMFSGYGGLDQGVQAVLGGTTSWHAEVDAAPSRILAHHHPDVPNLGDITTVDWATVAKVDVITGGFPCQDVSHAGKRLGLKPGTRSGLWSHMAYAIDQLRPALVVAENVRGLLSAEAASDLEPCAWCVGDGAGSPLRALGAVLGDLADLGYDASWYGLRAADVGAPHGRFRVFVFAWPTDANGIRWGWGRAAQVSESDSGRQAATQPSRPAAADPEGVRLATREQSSRDETQRPFIGGNLLPTPRATDGTKGGPNQRGSSGDLMLPSAVTLLPTPAVNDMGEGKTPEAWDEWTAKMQAAHSNGNGHGKSLAIEAQRLLPTPCASESGGERDLDNRLASGSQIELSDAVRLSERWGAYADAVTQWEALTRPAPAPTEPGKTGQPRLSPAFVEWLMGLPSGHVTSVPGLSRNNQLKALGNGVVPQQSAEATRRFLADVRAEVAA